MNEIDQDLLRTRRDFFRKCSLGIGNMALAHLLMQDGYAADVILTDPLAPRPPHFAPKAKAVIMLFMEGGPSQLDLFDPKPALQQWSGKSLPESITKDLQLAFIKPTAAVLASPRVFRPSGQCGTELCDWLPYTAACVDDICLIRSMHTDAFNHHPGQLLLFSGSTQAGRPTLGAWTVYGLGSESQNLPGFVVLTSGVGTSGGSSNWSSGFMPSTYQGVVFRNSGDPILYLSNPKGITPESQRATLDVIRELNNEHLEETQDQEVNSRIASYELAFRMQMAGPELLDFSKESPATQEMYGIHKDPSRQFGTNCLLARRMVERGVRFVMLAHASWDDHANLNKNLKKNCDITDQPVAALLRDLKQRGLLDTTLVIWGGEFGRTPMVELRRPEDVDNAGRDHHPAAYSMWMAGGGVKGGMRYGATDEHGIRSVENKLHIHDLHATVLHLLGLDHERLTYRYSGRDFRLTDVYGNVAKEIVS
jgi:hypothetical protein